MNVFSSVEPGEGTLEESTSGKGWWDHGQGLGQAKFRVQVEKERAPRGLRGGRNPWGRRNIRRLDANGISRRQEQPALSHGAAESRRMRAANGPLTMVMWKPW